MSNIPDHIIKRYGSARAFRSNKRRIVKQMIALNDELRNGCAFLPEGSTGPERIQTELRILAKELSVKNWGK